MKTKKQLLKELEQLKQALQDQKVTVNEYSTIYHRISQELRKL